MQLFVSTTWHGTHDTDLVAALEGVAGLDIDGVELGSTHCWRADLGQLVRDKSVGAILTHNYFPPARETLILNLASPDPDHRRASIDHAKVCIAFAAQIGAELYTVHPGFLNEPLAAHAARGPANYDFAFARESACYEAAFERMADALGDLVAAARRHGVRLAIETEGSLTSRGVLLMERPEEFERLFRHLPDGLWINFNLAHSALAAKSYEFSLANFIERFGGRFAAVEISHNDGERDEHRPLTADSWVFDWLPRLPDVPWILEFRNTARQEIAASVSRLRAWRSRQYAGSLPA